MKLLITLFLVLGLTACHFPLILRSTVDKEHKSAARSLERYINMPEKERTQNQKSIDFLEGYLTALEVIQGQ